MKIKYLFSVLLLMGLVLVATPAHADPPSGPTTVFTVNSFLDEPDANPGNGVCSSTPSAKCTLRAAIMESNTYCGSSYGCEEKIVLPAGTYKLTRVGADDTASKGDLDITGNVSIEGASDDASLTVIDGNGSVTNDRVFHILGSTNPSVSIRKLTITNGKRDRGGGIYKQSGGLTLYRAQVLSSEATNWGGGGIYNQDGPLTLDISTIYGNKTSGTYGFGGGIHNTNGNVYMNYTTVNNNLAGGTYGYGGGIYTTGSGGVFGGNNNISNNSTSDYGGGVRVSSGTFSMSKVTINNNTAGIAGGGVLNGGKLSLSESTLNGNLASQEGGGIYHTGDALTLSKTTVSGNQAVVSGGGIYAAASGTLTDSTIHSNQADQSGGGVYQLAGTLTVTNSTFSSNIAKGDGGGIRIYSPTYGAKTVLTNSTFSGNRANASGGGIYNEQGTVSLFSATIASNYADYDNNGSGLGGGVRNVNGTVNFRNTIIANNLRTNSFYPPADDCRGTLTSQDYNLISNGTGCTLTGQTAGNVNGADPKLDPLSNNGGPTKTHALQLKSPAIDRGNPNGCKDVNGADLTTDQRGKPRAIDGNEDRTARCDIGAYEYWVIKFP